MAERYLTADAAFALPPGFADRSVNIFEWAIGTSGDRLGLVLQRDRVKTKDLEAYVAKETKPYATRFDGYKLDGEEMVESSIAEAFHKRFRFKKDGDIVFMHQVFVLTGDRILLFTATAKAAHRETVEALVAELMGSLDLREEG